MKKVSGLRLEDLTSGFRVYDRRAIRRLAAWQATLLEYQDVGVLAMLQASGIRIKDVEVSMLPRRHGMSRIFYSWTSVFLLYVLHLTTKLHQTRHHPPPTALNPRDTRVLTAPRHSGESRHQVRDDESGLTWVTVVQDKPSTTTL